MREKAPLPKRQYRQGDTVPIKQGPTPVQSFHDVLNSQAINGKQTTNSAQLSQSAATLPQAPPSQTNHQQLTDSEETSDDTGDVCMIYEC